MMSDSDGDFSDELLELAGASEKKRMKRQSQGKSMKRRRTSGDLSDTDSDNEPSGNEEENENPYPLEGKYVDEEDRERLLGLPEVEREDILAQRQEELQRIQDKRNLDQMFRDRTGGTEESVAKAAKRQHAQRGATKEKSRKLDELRAKRKAKGEKKRTRTDSPRRDRSSSPMDMEMSDDEEDGQISRFEEEEEREQRLLDKSKADDGPVAVEELMKVCLNRDTLVKHWRKPWFEELIKGAWVRYSCGFDKERASSIYRICEVIQLVPRIVKEYRFDDRTADQEFLLKYAGQEKAWAMDKVSNSPFTEQEFQKLKKATESAGLMLPTKRELQKKATQIERIKNQSLTEADVKVMLAMKLKNESSGRSAASLTLEKSRLNQARTLALRRKDFAEVAELDKELAALTGKIPQTQSPAPTEKDMTAQREHRAKLEAMRKAEQVELERRRKERKARLLAATIDGTATPPLSTVKNLASLESRQATPGTPEKTTNGANKSPPLESIGDFESSVLDSVEIDLGDF